LFISPPPTAIPPSLKDLRSRNPLERLEPPNIFLPIHIPKDSPHSNPALLNVLLNIIILPNSPVFFIISPMKNNLQNLPTSAQDASSKLRTVLKNRHRLTELSTSDFLAGYQAIFFLAPGLHPDESDHNEGGWPLGWMSIAKEAFRRAALLSYPKLLIAKSRSIRANLNRDYFSPTSKRRPQCQRLNFTNDPRLLFYQD
jgi:hypothetical protein